MELVGEDEDKLLIRIEGDNRGESGRLPLMPPEARSKLDGTDAVTSAYVAHMGISGRFNEVGPRHPGPADPGCRGPSAGAEGDNIDIILLKKIAQCLSAILHVILL